MVYMPGSDNVSGTQYCRKRLLAGRKQIAWPTENQLCESCGPWLGTYTTPTHRRHQIRTPFVLCSEMQEWYQTEWHSDQHWAGNCLLSFCWQPNPLDTI